MWPSTVPTWCHDQLRIRVLLRALVTLLGEGLTRILEHVGSLSKLRLAMNLDVFRRCCKHAAQNLTERPLRPNTFWQALTFPARLTVHQVGIDLLRLSAVDKCIADIRLQPEIHVFSLAKGN